MPDKKHLYYGRLLLVVAGLGGLLYGVDLGIIAGALPYLEATSGLNTSQLSIVVAAVLLGSVISTLFAGLLADWIGRKPLMTVSGVLFVASIPTIALSQAYAPLLIGRLLQGISAGLIGVVVPLYLAECLEASSRGKGTGIFQWLLTFGIVAAALVAMFFSFRVSQVAALGDPARLLAFKDAAWRGIFWVSLPPGIVFVIGTLLVAESPRWLVRHGKKSAAYGALLRSRSAEQADLEFKEMETVSAIGKENSALGSGKRESLAQRKYIVPFVLACLILACTQATGVNSIIAYNINILSQSGLSDLAAHWGYVAFTIVNFVMTFVGVTLVDRKGRKFLLTVGTAGIMASLIFTGVLFRNSERQGIDAKDRLLSFVGGNEELKLNYNDEVAAHLLGRSAIDGHTTAPTSLTLIYSYGDFRAATNVARSDDASPQPIEINRKSCVPSNKIIAFFMNPFANLDASRTAELKIEKALIGPVPSAAHGWLVAISLFLFMSFYAIGPGVCVWLALSELMPTRIRSKGMSIALVLNQAVSTTIAAIFLPTVGKYGYSSMFFAFAGCTILYFITAMWFLPETNGKTLEEIEAHFSGAIRNVPRDAHAIRRSA